MSLYRNTNLKDTHGHATDITPVNELTVAEPVVLVGTQFRTSNDSNFWTLTSSGTGASATENVLATLTSGTSNNGYGQISSNRLARFISGVPNKYRGIHRVTSVTATNNTRRFGAFTVSGQTPQDGFYFEISGAGVLSVNCVKGGSVTTVASGSFNGNATTYTLDTNAHSFEIIYFVKEATFYIDDVLIHKITPTTAPCTNTLNFPAVATSINSAGGTVSGVLECWLMSIKRLGQYFSEARTFNISGNANTYTLKLGAGRIHRFIFNNTSGTSISIFDNTSASGTSLGVITTTSSALGSWDMDIPFFNGLTLVTTGNGLDLTVVYE